MNTIDKFLEAGTVKDLLIILGLDVPFNKVYSSIYTTYSNDKNIVISLLDYNGVNIFEGLSYEDQLKILDNYISTNKQELYLYTIANIIEISLIESKKAVYDYGKRIAEVFDFVVKRISHVSDIRVIDTYKLISILPVSIEYIMEAAYLILFGKYNTDRKKYSYLNSLYSRYDYKYKQLKNAFINEDYNKDDIKNLYLDANLDTFDYNVPNFNYEISQYDALMQDTKLRDRILSRVSSLYNSLYIINDSQGDAAVKDALVSIINDKFIGRKSKCIINLYEDIKKCADNLSIDLKSIQDRLTNKAQELILSIELTENF